MRFEIRGGGAFLILAGLIGLSGAVFALGLVAGYEMARQNQPDLSQISTTYPLPSPPPSESTPAPEAASTPAAALPPAAPPAPKAIASPPAPIARLKPPAVMPALTPPPAETNSDTSNEETASIPVPQASATAASRKPFNIQIEAVMDKSGADEMLTRLKALGYNAQEMTIILGGETWYRVRIGPYNTEAEAKAAQDRLREQYKQAYTGPR